MVLLAVFPERKIEEEPIEPPDTIQFERDRYQVAWGKKRRRRIEASVSFVMLLGVYLDVYVCCLLKQAVPDLDSGQAEYTFTP